MNEELEKNIETISKPVLTRLEKYWSFLQKMRLDWTSYFFPQWRLDRLTKTVKKGQNAFNTEETKALLEQCLAPEETLYLTAQELQEQLGYRSLPEAFDMHITNSGLAIKRDANGGYIFSPDKPFTPEAQTYMEQFARALGTYRFCLELCEIYYSISHHDSIQANSTFSEKISALKAKASDGQTDLIELHLQGKNLYQEIKNQLTAGEINKALESFKEFSNEQGNKLKILFNSLAHYLEICYKEFPNDAIAWLLHDRTWHAFFKNIANELYDGQYTYSTRNTTLTIYPEYIKTLEQEILQFCEKMTENLSSLRSERLKDQLNELAGVRNDIRAKLAVQGIEVPQAPKGGLFAQPKIDFYTAGIQFLNSQYSSGRGPS